MEPVRYRHRQTNVVFVALSAVFLGVLGLQYLFRGSVALGFLTLALIGLYLVLLHGFSGLQTEVDDRAVTAAFRYGWPRRRIPLEAIASHRPVRNRWWYGLGIRYVPGGWMFSVWGLDAVEVSWVDGRGASKTFRIGTDDPTGLTSAIAEASGVPPAPAPMR